MKISELKFFGVLLCMQRSSLYVFLIFFFTFFCSCYKLTQLRTKSELETPGQLTQIYARQLLADEVAKETGGKTDTKEPTSIKRSRQKMTRLQQLQADAAWDQGRVSYSASERIYSVPVNPQTNQVADHRYQRAIVFCQTGANPMEYYILEFLGKEGQSIKALSVELINQAFSNYKNNQTNVLADLDGYLIVYYGNYIQKQSFDLVKGKCFQSEQQVRFRSDLDISID